MYCFFVSDIHGKTERYEKLFNEIIINKPDAVFLGGDLLPHFFVSKNFVQEFLASKLTLLKNELGNRYPKIFLILGNDDARSEEQSIIEVEKKGLLEYIHFKHTSFGKHKIFGYTFTPPSPFLLKDWEKYDVSRYVDPGCISPEDGKRTVEIPSEEKKKSTIKDDLIKLTTGIDLTDSIFLFHGPPYKTNLDRAALDGKIIDHVPLDVNVGSIAIKTFIEEKQPYLTLHGHIHESASITGRWKDKIGQTTCFSAAHSGSELALVKFNTEDIDNAERILI